FAQHIPEFELENGRYVIVLPESSPNSAGIIRKIPVLILDSKLGIVWKCRDIEEERPEWSKIDLAKMSQPSSTRRYIIKIPYYRNESKMPAIVLDIEEGKTWICPNIFEDGIRWFPVDLVNDVRAEMRMVTERKGE
ncbi:MAG: hypothetical protein KKC84_02510, partial [Candidatus Omnitrophica bacterium]|nr:hypothetical protein [Candidatus Omnitrophota bacterium]